MSVGDGPETYLLGGQVRFLAADRRPCPICGHPTGDCPGDPEAAPRSVVGADVFPSLQHEEVHIVAEDIWEQRAITPFTTARVLVAAKGTAIPKSKAEELGLL